MKKYTVEIPFTGVCSMDVEAESEKDAIAKAMDTAIIQIDEKESTAFVDQIELHENVVRGNVFYGVRNQASAQENK